jgi:hypothetical protein
MVKAGLLYVAVSSQMFPVCRKRFKERGQLHSAETFQVKGALFLRKAGFDMQDSRQMLHKRVEHWLQVEVGNARRPTEAGGQDAKNCCLANQDKPTCNSIAPAT